LRRIRIGGSKGFGFSSRALPAAICLLWTRILPRLYRVLKTLNARNDPLPFLASYENYIIPSPAEHRQDARRK
jgi:hypothetical protein